MKYSYHNYYRGKQFRSDFACISEIRSLLPKHTNVMTGVIVGFAKAETFIASFVTYQIVDEGKEYRNGVTRLWKDRVPHVQLIWIS